MADVSTILHDETAQARFWAKVDKREPDECWLWMGSRNSNDYGRFNFSGLKVGAHRMSLMMAISRQMSSEEFACHHCDNPPCVNPAHLYVGSIQTNIRDMSERDRFHRWHGARKGETNPKAKLTDDDVLQIRALKGLHRQRELVQIFGVSQTTISHVLNRKVWGHVD